MEKIKLLIKNILCRVSPELFSRYQFRRKLGKRLDLNHPTGLNAKIMWLKLHPYRNSPLVMKCSDKYAVREYIAACGYPEILNDLYEVWERAEDIDWDTLPPAFVLKCNHGCGYNWLCPDKSAADPTEAMGKLKEWMQEDYWIQFAELQYRHIPRRIICERYLGSPLVDYKIYCFNGKPMYILTCVGRADGLPSHTAGHENPRFYFFDADWNLCRLTNDSLHCPVDFTLPRPESLDQMLEIAKKLSEPFPFVRVDLYDANGHVVFGELTFTPSAALDTTRLPETDRLFGELLKLDQTPIDPDGEILRRCEDMKEQYPGNL